MPILPPDFLDQIFADFPPGQTLLAEVRAFYGPALWIERHDEPDGISHFAIDTGAAAFRLGRVTIQLNTTTSRTKPAFFHELLHLSLPIRGFDVLHALSAQSQHHVALDHINNVQASLTNVVQHDIFLPDFLRSGLPIEHFLAAGRKTLNYRQAAKKQQDQRVPEQWPWFVQSFWGFEYLNNYLAELHGNGSAGLTKETYKIGCRVLPTFSKTAHSLREWVKSGEHLEPATYAAAMVKVMYLLQMPQIESFAKLAPVAGSFPRVEPRFL